MASCCCSTNNAPAKRHICPANGQEYLQVAESTVLQHLKKPWQQKLTQQAYYYCDDPDCDVVYFGEDNSSLTKDDLRTVVGLKQPRTEASLLCYCFDITYNEFNQDSALEDYVVEKTKNGFCACESQNPSGKCCLKEFQKCKKQGGCV